MPNRKKQCWRLALAAQVTFCCGCLSTGSRYAGTNDPFLEPTTPVADSTTPALVPLPPVEVAQAPTIQLMKFVQEGEIEPISLSQPATQPVPERAEEPIPAELIAEVAVAEVAVAEVAIGSEQPQSLPEAQIVPFETFVEAPLAEAPLLAESPIESGVYPIDLANALGLGGADNLQVRLARTRLFQAQARHLQAKALWLPSIRLGVGYNKHDGRLQETTGNVIEVERNSLFYGGGFGLGGMPLTGGAGGPPRLAVNLSLADAYFKPLSACQEVAAQGAAERVASNDSLAEIALGYHSLLEAHGRLANATDARDMSQKMVGLVEDFEREGFSSQSEVSRARTALGRWQRDVADAERQTVTTSARLARVLRLPAQVQLVPVEEFLMPVDCVDSNLDLDALITDAWHRRPEVSQGVARREAACFRVQEEKWRPWIPNVQAGASGGGFGGGPSTTFPSASDRSDVDLLAVWEWENMGLGNVARQRLRRGELHERVLEIESLRDQIAAEVVAAAADVTSYREQMKIAQQAITAAEQSYQLNEQRIRESEGLPIELLQSISALAEARNAYTETVANYNRSQYRLLRALGNPVGQTNSVPAT